ncbi:MAG TPA: hypothetical protein VHV55_18440 [Pirellulales bacterium]|jgi:hypothetical protein|nr:hypothetical protein [Pirellulales bacterium]
MPIKKQEFYEGAALYRLARTGRIAGVRYEPPFFVLNDSLLVLLKYSTRSRSPWAFTFTTDEQQILSKRATTSKTIIGLICGADGVAAFPFDSYIAVAPPRQSAIHIACYRRHGKHYEVAGPDGSLDGKIAPSTWLKILE